MSPRRPARAVVRLWHVVVLAFALLVVAASPALAGVWLPDVFGDDMVLQAEQRLPVWGKADPGDRVRVEFEGERGRSLATARTVADDDGRWSVTLDPLPAGRRGRLVVRGPAEGDERRYENVLTGECWLFSGQSNMRWTVARSSEAEATIAAADLPEVRLFVVETIAAGAPLDNLRGEWVVCSPETVASFSGVAYHFGRRLHERLDRPVGLILSAVGGTPIQSWLPLEQVRDSPELVHLWNDFQDYVKQPADERERSRGTWIYGDRFQRGPGRLYNAMIHPVAPYALRGMAWYQGESNSRESRWGGPSLYRRMFPLLVESWRKRWERADLPFLYVELAGYRERQTEPVQSGGSWAEIRAAQSVVLELPGVHAVTAIDVGEVDDIHPPDKRTVGHRLALAALGQVHDAIDGPSLSPRYRDHAVEGGAIRVRLHDAVGLTLEDDATRHAFAIRAADGPWQWARVRIDGEDLVLSHPEIDVPAAVRHAWADHPFVTVRNAAGLPLMPFRTDHGEQ